MYCPDTDILHCGLSCKDLLQQTHIILQMNMPGSTDKKYIDINALMVALDTDPDLQELPLQLRPIMLQTGYLLSGCDYISYWHGLGKITFLKTLLRHSGFINAPMNQPGVNVIGNLTNTHSENQKVGFLSFIRLVGCLYFNKHKGVFESANPESCFKSVYSEDDPPTEHHKKWISCIREAVWTEIQNEEDLPSWNSLNFHWLRTCWVSTMY